MTIAAKHLDPLVGLDTHIILIPTPAGPVPTPLPHPYVGILFDPSDYAPFIGASTYINGLPRGVAGSNGKATPPHIPMGGPFAKPPTNESEIFMGSATVLTDGDPQSFLGLPVLSCQDIGMPAPPRPKKKSVAKTLMLPTTVILCIPMGMLVLIGGPPTVSMMSIAQKLGLGALKKFKKGKLMRKLSDKLHKLANKLADKLKLGKRARALVHKAICTVTGHPVDVATGKVFTDKVDFEFPGAIPITWERTWYSTSSYAGPLGYGWHHSYDQTLYLDDGVVLFQTPDGRHVAFPPLKQGGEYYNRSEKLTLFCDTIGYGIRTADGLTLRFVPVPGRARTNQPLAEIRDTVGNAVRLRYDERGNLRQIVDCAGRLIDLIPDQSGRITAVTAPHPDAPDQRVYLMRYAYDGLGNLATATDALGQVASFTYQQHLMVRETDRRGLSFYFNYDAGDENARCTRTWGDGGIYDHKLTYDAERSSTVVEDSLGHKTTYVHRDGLVIKVVDPAGNVSTREFNDFNEEILETDALGNATQSVYDQRGNLIESSYPDGTKLKLAYDGSDSLIEAQDAGGGIWKYEYDAWRRMVAEIDPLGARTEYVHDRAQLIEIREPNGQSSVLGYDGQGNVTGLRRSSGWQMEWTYDAWGRDVAVRDVNGNVHALALDLLGRLVRLQEPDGRVRDYGYDPEGNILSESSFGNQVTYTYAGQRAMASRTQDGTTVRFEYDTEMQLVAVVNEHGVVYRYVHGATGEVVEEIGYDGLMRKFEYDALNRVVKLEVPNVGSSVYGYDAQGRLTQIAHSDGEKAAFQYTPMGELSSATNSTTTVTYQRDLLGRVLRETQGAHWVESEYDSQGERVALRSSLGTDQKIERNAQGEAKSITERGSYRVDITRDVLGNELERQMPGGVRSQWTRDRLGRPLQHQVSSQVRATRAVAYEWDPSGRLRKIIDAFRGNNEFVHDGRDRLSFAQLYDRTQVSRMPDAVGNLFRSQLRNDRRYGPAGQLLESYGPSGVTRFAYDTLGNLIEKVQPGGRRWRYTWSSAGQLAAVERPDGSVVRFAYDALGRRVQKVYRGQTTAWVWDDDVPLHEWVTGTLEPLVPDTSVAPEVGGDVARRRDAELEALLARGPPSRGSLESPITWLFLPDALVPLARLCGDEQLSIITDHIGTPVAAHDARGDEVWSATISPDGALHELRGDPHAIPFRFEGQYEDGETGLHYNRFRYYDPEAGVYVGRDPIGLAGGTALYAYVGDPLTQTDPFGLHKNQKLAGSNHPVTGVPFNRNGYPVFDSAHDAKLPPSLLKATDPKQFAECNRQLANAIDKNPALKKKFTPAQLKQIANGETPKGFIWHHHQRKGKMQLVNKRIHARTGHAGGKAKWGGGKACR